jgi:hypothetical protein
MGAFMVARGGAWRHVETVEETRDRAVSGLGEFSKKE